MARAKVPLLFLALVLAAPLAAPAQDAATGAPAKKVYSPLNRMKAAPSSQAWWMGTVFMILALGAAGAVCAAARKQGACGATVKLQVVGRTSLPPKHAIFAVKVGGRTLLIGTGPQGAPSLLGELEAEEEVLHEPAADSASTAPRVDVAAAAVRRPVAAQPRFDVRIGDES